MYVAMALTFAFALFLSSFILILQILILSLPLVHSSWVYWIQGREFYLGLSQILGNNNCSHLSKNKF